MCSVIQEATVTSLSKPKCDCHAVAATLTTAMVAVTSGAHEWPVKYPVIGERLSNLCLPFVLLALRAQYTPQDLILARH